MLRLTLALVLSLAVACAHAQLGLPGVRVPLTVPQVPTVDRTLQGIDAQLGGSVLQDARALQARRGLSTARALVRLRALVPGGSFDFNHVYSQSAAAAAGEPGDPASPLP